MRSQAAIDAVRRWRLCAISASVALLFASFVHAQTRTGTPSFDPALIAAQSGTDDEVHVIVQLEPGSDPTSIRSALGTRGNQVVAEHKLLNAVSARVKITDVRDLANNPAVRHVSKDAVVATESVQPMAATNAVLQAISLESPTVTGRGVGVAVIDSGIQRSRDLHPTAAFDFTRGTVLTGTTDEYGHGTHVAGLIGGSGVESLTGPAMHAIAPYQGVAPGVRLIDLKVLDDKGQGSTSNVIRAIEFATAFRRSLGIDVLNLSNGHPITEPAADDPLVQAVEQASRAGLIVVVAAGNWGRNTTTGIPSYGGILSPANAPSAITVGAVNTNDGATRDDDAVAGYSSRGPTWLDEYVKPDVVAPGQNLVSDAALGSWLYDTYASQRVADANGADHYLRLSGTSMAAAVTSGIVALLIEANRHAGMGPLTPNHAKAILEYSATPLAEGDVFVTGAGEVNAAAALAVLATGSRESTQGGTSGFYATGSSGGATTAQTIIWGNTIIWGSSIPQSDPAWATTIIWGSGALLPQSTLTSAARTQLPADWYLNTVTGVTGSLASSVSPKTIIWGSAAPPY